ncbi:MAG: indole-3-glycerol phosphate synthase [Candidatus Paceibacteria bacterium]|jgi:indole-3-glycerol phosphate synthase
MKPPERLGPIMAAVAQRAAERRRVRSLESLRQDVQLDPARREQFVGALRQPGLSIIAECKRRAPSSGELSQEVDLQERIRSYAAGGADALSILTEADHFGGSLEDLSAAPEVEIPRLRKDFLLDEAMLLEAQYAGAKAVLLIAACLDPEQLKDLRQIAAGLGLGVLLEVHNRAELAVALPLQPDALGVNARDLTTFAIDLAVSEALLPEIPKSCVRVAESGLYELADLQRMQAAGADAVLIGTSLMRSPDPSQTLRDWKEGLDA